MNSTTRRDDGRRSGPGGRARRPERDADPDATHACLRVAVEWRMQEALLVRVAFPPPASGSLALAGFGRAGARRAADRRIAPVVERVMVDAVGVEVVPDLGARPARQRYHLGDVPVAGVAGDNRGLRPGRGLLASQPGDPRVVVTERASQRVHLAYRAALVAQTERTSELHRSVLGGHRVELT